MGESPVDKERKKTKIRPLWRPRDGASRILEIREKPLRPVNVAVPPYL